MMAGLRAIAGGMVREVRGRGLMIAVELDPAAGGARAYCQALQARGLLCKETHDHTIRIAPPLVITANQVDWAIDQFAAVLG
jgi:ornithine--oxo-acid transaminase